MVNRYTFSQLFGYNPQTGFVYPLFPTWVNNIYFDPYINISRGIAFGGFDIYGVYGRDVAAIPNSPTNGSITIVGFY